MRVRHWIWGWLFLFLILGFMKGPAQAAGLPITTPYYCLLDADSGQVLTMKNGDTPRAVASTTKIMTAILAIEYAQADETAQVSLHADRTAEYTIGLRSGQEIKVGELLKVALIRSANDAAVVLAEHVAGDEDLFGHLMTQKAFCIGAFNTHFINASGLPAPDSHSTAYDLAVISRYALSNPAFQAIVSQPSAQFKHPGYNQPFIISNTNTLLDSYPGANGVKTGTTDAAGKCLVGAARRSGRELIAVVLRSGDRSGDCARLLDYGFKNMQQSKIVDSQSPFKEIPIANGEPSWLQVYPQEDLQVWQGSQKLDLVKKVQMHYFWQAPVSRGEKVGILEVYAQGKLLKRIGLVTGNEVKKEPSGLKMLWREFFREKGNIQSSKE